MTTLSADEKVSLLEQNAPVLKASFKQLSDLYLLAEQGYVPVRGFLGSGEVQRVTETMHLSSGEPWSIPIIFPVDEELATSLSKAERLVLEDETGVPAGVLHIEEIFKIDKSNYARHIFRTEDAAHPGVDWLLQSGDFSLAGPVQTFEDWEFNLPGGLPFSPGKVRAETIERGWKKVVGFQTRNPIHRAHEFVTKIALETADGLVIHPLLGETKPDDTPVEVRLACYRSLIDNYYSPEHTLLAGFPAWMRYAGPREAVFHAQVRKNYGVTHFIVGRDHAGVGSYYGPFDAQHIFSEFEPGELGIEPIFFDMVHYCKACGQMTSPKTCPHSKEERVFLSGTAVRKMLAEGEMPPAEFTRSEVAKILVEAATRK